MYVYMYTHGPIHFVTGSMYVCTFTHTYTHSRVCEDNKHSSFTILVPPNRTNLQSRTCTCMCTCECTCVHVHMHMYIHTFTGSCVHVHVHMYMSTQEEPIEVLLNQLGPANAFGPKDTCSLRSQRINKTHTTAPLILNSSCFDD